MIDDERIPDAADPARWARLDPDALLTITVVGYGYTHEWHIIVNSLLAQTDDRWVAQLINDGPDPIADGICSSYVEQYPDRLAYAETRIRLNNHGHSLRVIGLQATVTPYWCTQNGDNYLVPRFVELALEAATQAHPASVDRPVDVVIFPIVHNYENVHGYVEPAYSVLNTQLRRNRCDAGSMIVRTELARQVGWRSLARNADGEFVEDLRATRPAVVAVPSVLMVHN